MQKYLVIVIVLAVSLFDRSNAAAVTRITKPKDYDQQMSAASYYYRTEHVEPPHSFVTGNAFPGTRSAAYYSSGGGSGYSKPLSSYSSSSSSGGPGNDGTFSYVSNHGGVQPGSSVVIAPPTDTLPLRHHVSVEVNDDEIDSEEPALNSHEALNEDISSYSDSGIDSESHEVAPLSAGHYSHGTFHHVHDDGDHGSGFSKGAKKSHGSEYYEKKGDRGKQSYDNSHKSHSGKKGHYDNADSAGHHESKGGKESSHHDEGDQYAKHHESGHKVKGGKHGEKKHHKKGSKTTGFHNVYHKDEYKKDHSFYDESDHRGNFEKHAAEEKKHHADEGQYKKGGHHDSAYKEGHSKKHGSEATGHVDNQHKKFKGKHGYDKHYNDHEGHGKKHGHSEHSADGYEEGSEHGHY